MGEGFIFEAPSDEEVIYSEVDSDDEELEEDEVPTSQRRTQSPWEFGSYYGSVDEEHARRNTTSIDSKITKAIQQRSLGFDSSVVEDEENVESESDGQENFVLEEEEEDDDDGEVACDAGDKQPFYEYLDRKSLHANSFMELHLSRPLLRSCEALGYLKPTPIQATCIPLAISGRDICGSAITGSGKTAAYTLPTLERLYNAPKRSRAIRALILTPTRELAVQVHSMIEKLAQFTDIRCCLILGGVSVKTQEAALRSMPDIVVATPGRMIDHLQNSMSVDLDDLAILILDEADRLLEENFAMETKRLVSLCPRNRQTMLFSATMTDKVNELIKLSLTNPLRLSVDPSMKRPAALTEEIVRIRRMREANQEAVLFALCSKTYTSKVIVFSKTKQEAHRLKILFGLTGFKAAELHGNLTQVQRLDALELFRNQQVDFLIATDVAARGLDIKGVQTVINYACPRNLTSYTHRVGRTARIGRKGHAVTFVLDDDRSLLKSIAKKAGAKLKSRNVAEQSITKWSQIIEQMEDQVKEILQEEREERALRKAEMEVTKAENMIAHREEIFSRPKRTWFVTEKEKRLVAKAAKASLEKDNKSGKEIISAEAAEDLKAKEKRKREREKHLPRKKRRKLEAAREMLEETKMGDKGGSGKNEEKSGISLVDVAYRRAKAAKAAKKAVDSGKIVRKASESKHHLKRSKSRPEEMRELFQSDMSDRKQKRNDSNAGRKKSKNSFKSKSRYKRR